MQNKTKKLTGITEIDQKAIDKDPSSSLYILTSFSISRFLQMPVYWRVYLTAALVFICLFSPAAFSQTKKKKTSTPCAKFVIQAKVTDCANREYQKANREMNQIYQVLLVALAENSDDADDQQKLKESQSRWLAYRDAECDSEASIYEDGTRQPAAYSLCLAAVSRERTTRLKAFLAETKQ